MFLDTIHNVISWVFIKISDSYGSFEIIGPHSRVGQVLAILWGLGNRLFIDPSTLKNRRELPPPPPPPRKKNRSTLSWRAFSRVFRRICEDFASILRDSFREGGGEAAGVPNEIRKLGSGRTGNGRRWPMASRRPHPHPLPPASLLDFAPFVFARTVNLDGQQDKRKWPRGSQSFCW